MSHNSIPAKVLRFIGIVLMALTGGLTLLGGVGTTCVALFPTNYGPVFAKIADFQWLYILFVLAGIAIGVMGIRATVMLVKGAEKSYRDALVALIAGTVVGFIHIFASRALRGGSSMPVDPIVYFGVVTLVVFLLFKIPGVWQGVDFTKGKSKENKPARGASAILLGIVTLTIQYTMEATHLIDGVNYADAFHTSMLTIGLGLMLLGAALFVNWGKLTAAFRKPVPAQNNR
ncbi:MAG: hypothetical protein M5U11_10680 [Anaerolineales bacterium]|nr:hypothetical protein [Anaerolineales bacterium]